MALDTLKSALAPGDLLLNLRAVVDRATLTPQQLWGTLLVSAIAVRSPAVLRAVAAEAREAMTPEAFEEARSTGSSMAMSNVFFRTRHLLSDPVYGTLRTGLRTGLPHTAGGADRLDVELWSLAASAIGGCPDCLDAHEAPLRRAGVAPETVQEAFRAAAVIQAVATALEADEVLAEADERAASGS
jgi:lipoyl-dependent peroxiredoxin subunit D